MIDSELLSALEAFDKAIRICGSQTTMANICGCTPGNISQLVLKHRPLSPKFVLKVEAATGVSRHDLRPDIYPRDDPSHSPETEHSDPAPVHPRGTGAPVASKSGTHPATTRDWSPEQPVPPAITSSDDKVGVPAR